MADENSTANTARRAAGKLHSISNNVGGSTELKPPLPQRAVTTRYEFDATPYNGKLFSVNAGIPLSDAFDQLTMLLEASQLAIADIGFAVDSGEKPQSQWGAAYLGKH